MNETSEHAIEITTAPISSINSLDDNYELYKSMRGVDVDPVEARKVLRKVDCRILSVLMVTYFLQVSRQKFHQPCKRLWAEEGYSSRRARLFMAWYVP